MSGGFRLPGEFRYIADAGNVPASVHSRSGTGMARLANLLLFLATLVVCVLGLELGFRAWSGVAVFQLVDWRRAHLQRAEANEATGAAIYDATLGWTMRAGYASADMNLIDQGVRKNGAGDTALRTGGILAVGDSFTAGSQVNDAETWPAQLEALTGVPVVNAAVGGYGIDQMVLRAEQLLPAVRPRVLIVGTQDQGILRVGFSSYGRPKPYFTIEQGALVAHNQPAPRYDVDPETEPLWLRLLGYSYVADQLMGLHDPAAWYTQDGQRFIKAPAVDDAGVSCRMLERLKATTDREQIRLALLLQYGGNIAQWPEPPPYAARVSACARAAGLLVIDEFASLKRIADRSIDEFKSYYVLMPDPAQPYGHMSAKGNHHVASLIAEALARDAALPTAAAAASPAAR